MSAESGRRAAATPERILDVAEGLLQARGYNGFSYADVAGELRITRAALHYHYRGKAELGEALTERIGTFRVQQGLRILEAEQPLRRDGRQDTWIEGSVEGRPVTVGEHAPEDSGA